jgi:hypothetical protein
MLHVNKYIMLVCAKKFQAFSVNLSQIPSWAQKKKALLSPYFLVADEI